MLRKFLVAVALVTFVGAPAMAATTYYVSQDQTTHKCYIVTKIGKNGKQIGTSGYPTKVKAKAALAAAPECKAEM